MSKGMSAYVFRASIEVEVTEEFVSFASSFELTPEEFAQILCDTAPRESLRRAIINRMTEGVLAPKLVCLPPYK